MKITDRIKHGWNAFLNRDPTYNYRDLGGPSYGYRPDRMRFTRGNKRPMPFPVYLHILYGRSPDFSPAGQETG